MDLNGRMLYLHLIPVQCCYGYAHASPTITVFQKFSQTIQARLGWVAKTTNHVPSGSAQRRRTNCWATLSPAAWAFNFFIANSHQIKKHLWSKELIVLLTIKLGQGAKNRKLSLRSRWWGLACLSPNSMHAPICFNVIKGLPKDHGACCRNWSNSFWLLQDCIWKP